ncbi:ParA family protein [Thioflexithrix psekupsensis]|uniref:Chromosome partitioning protein n=1 Tax=Thioflexithrix psekupsensis TaxID=1570016 RepID=A0A251X2Z6_9GAMM|nr:AAA family ATPase [Thioflexithrix psekupsensis]OUD11646.1 chromosome partitioning protein [Thioflexithrix psekupsensis]
MNAPIIAFFNNKGGVGKTSLVYHLAWMYQRLGLRVIAVDLDPQANLTAAFLSEDRLEEIWLLNQQPSTIFRAVHPLMRGTGDVIVPQLEVINSRLHLLVGDLQLSEFEGNLALEWPGCMDRKELSFRVTSAFWRLLQQLQTHQHPANVILLDLGPNLGAINRAALIASDYVVVPLSPDLFSLQGLKNLGPTLRRWRAEWHERRRKNPTPELLLPQGQVKPVGYVVLQHLQYAANTGRPVKAYERWLEQITGTYWHAVLNRTDIEVPNLAEDPYCLALVRHYKSLMPLAQAARKPIFDLTGHDGLTGGNVSVAQQAVQDFEQLARRIARNCKAYQQK